MDPLLGRTVLIIRGQFADTRGVVSSILDNGILLQVSLSQVAFKRTRCSQGVKFWKKVSQKAGGKLVTEDQGVFVRRCDVEVVG